jgi:hypothetical protein
MIQRPPSGNIVLFCQELKETDLNATLQELDSKKIYATANENGRFLVFFTVDQKQSKQ